MTQQSWNEARLIPVTGIGGSHEQEQRATSALLAVMSSVLEFGRAIVGPLGAPGGKIRAYTEVPFMLNGKRHRPDGLLRVVRGTRTWTCLVEVKTGRNNLERPQLEAYLDIANERGYDALLTISHELPPAPGLHPSDIDKRKLRGVALHHLSWSQILASADMHKEHYGVADPDQAWILGELIRYLEHANTKALQFVDMGPAWKPVREAAVAGMLHPNSPSLPEVAARFDSLIRFCGIRLSRRLGAEVTPVCSKLHSLDPALRNADLVESLVTTGRMSGAIRIPGTVAPLWITADLRSSLVLCRVELDAPKDRRPATQVNWLVRQLKNAPPEIRVEAFAAYSRNGGRSETLGEVRNDQMCLVEPGNPQDLRTFRMTQVAPLGPNSSGHNGAIETVFRAVDQFYSNVVKGLKVWEPAPIVALGPEPEILVESGVHLKLIQSGTLTDERPGAFDDSPQRSSQPAPPTPAAALAAESPVNPAGAASTALDPDPSEHLAVSAVIACATEVAPAPPSVPATALGIEGEAPVEVVIDDAVSGEIELAELISSQGPAVPVRTYRLGPPPAMAPPRLMAPPPAALKPMAPPIAPPWVPEHRQRAARRLGA